MNDSELYAAASLLVKEATGNYTTNGCIKSKVDKIDKIQYLKVRATVTHRCGPEYVIKVE